MSAPAARRRIALAAAVSLGLLLIAVLAAVPIDHQLGPGHKLYWLVRLFWALEIILCVATIALLKSDRWRMRPDHDAGGSRRGCALSSRLSSQPRAR